MCVTANTHVCDWDELRGVDAQEGGDDGQHGKEGGAQLVDELVTSEGKGQDADGGNALESHGPPVKGVGPAAAIRHLVQESATVVGEEGVQGEHLAASGACGVSNVDDRSEADTSEGASDGDELVGVLDLLDDVSDGQVTLAELRITQKEQETGSADYGEGIHRAASLSLQPGWALMAASVLQAGCGWEVRVERARGDPGPRMLMCPPGPADPGQRLTLVQMSLLDATPAR